MIRNQLLYPAELRGRLGFPPFLRSGSCGQAERKVINGHAAAQSRHNFGHNGSPSPDGRVG